MTRRQWIYRIQPSRPDMLATGPTPEEESKISEHFEYLKALAEEGTVMLAGRTLNTDPSSFGIVIYNAEDVMSARKIFEGDPAVRAGIFTGELFPFSVALRSRK